MRLLQRFSCVGPCFAAALFMITTAASGAPGKQTTKPAASSDSSNDPSSRDYRLPNETDRDKLLAEIKDKLNTYKPSYGKKTDEDFFVIGTIDLKEGHATVDYAVKAGVQTAAEFVVDFILGKETGAVREWRVFNRAKSKKAAEALAAKAKSESIESKLSAFKRNVPGKKTPEDYFVIGTADLNSKTEHADIRFEILAGVGKAADFLINFIFNRPKEHKGEWHVFYRAHTEEQATTYRQQLRDEYDALEAQRAQMAAIYNAKTTART